MFNVSIARTLNTEDQQRLADIVRWVAGCGEWTDRGFKAWERYSSDFDHHMLVEITDLSDSPAWWEPAMRMVNAGVPGEQAVDHVDWDSLRDALPALWAGPSEMRGTGWWATRRETLDGDEIQIKVFMKPPRA